MRSGVVGLDGNLPLSTTAWHGIVSLIGLLQPYALSYRTNVSQPFHLREDMEEQTTRIRSPIYVDDTGMETPLRS